MNTTKKVRRPAAALAVIPMFSALALVPANADASSMEQALCTVACGIAANDANVQPGDTFTVDLVGAPGAKVAVQLYFNQDSEFGPVGKAVDVVIGDNGRADDVAVQVPSLPAGTPGGQAFVHLADWNQQWNKNGLEAAQVDILTDTPMAWNWSEPDDDGKIHFEAAVGGEFKTQFGYAIPGQVHLLEILVDGQWETLGYKPQDQSGPVLFGVPPTVGAGEYQMRIANTQLGTTGAEDVYVLHVKGKAPSKDKAPDKDVAPKLPKTGV